MNRIGQNRQADKQAKGHVDNINRNLFAVRNSELVQCCLSLSYFLNGQLKVFRSLELFKSRNVDRMGQNRQADRQAKGRKKSRKVDRMGQTGKGQANKHKNGQDRAG
jgi:hypothetical protein